MIFEWSLFLNASFESIRKINKATDAIRHVSQNSRNKVNQTY